MTVGEVTEGGARDVVVDDDDDAGARVAALVWVSAGCTCVDDKVGSSDKDDADEEEKEEVLCEVW